jgi:hypothetical protein
MRLLGITNVGSDVIDQLLIRLSALEKQWEYNETVHQLLIDFKKAYDSVRKEVLYNILIEFGVPMKVVRLIKMRLNETYSNVRIGKHLFDSFPIQNGLKQGGALSPLLVNLLRYDKDTIKKNTETLIDASKEVGLEISVDNTKYMLLSRQQNVLVGQNRDTKIANR